MNGFWCTCCLVLLVAGTPHGEAIARAPLEAGASHDAIASVPSRVLPDTAVILRVGDRVLRGRDFVERYFASSVEFRPQPDSAGRLAFLRSLTNKEVLALTALTTDRPLGRDDSLTLARHENRALANALFQRAVRDSVRVTEADLRRLHTQYGWEQHFRHLVVADPRMAAMLRDSLARGRITWDAAVARHPLPAGKGSDRGDMGWLGRGMLEPRMARAVWDLRPGEIAPVVHDRDGFHVLQCIARRPAERSSFDSMRDRLREQMRAEREAALADRFQERMASRIGMEVDTGNVVWAAARFRESEVRGPQAGVPVLDLSGRMPEFAPADSARLLAQHRDGRVTLGDLLRKLESSPPLLRPRLGTFASLHARVRTMVLEPAMVAMARTRGLERDPMVQQARQRKREEILVGRLYEDSVRSRVSVSPLERRSYYEKHIAQYVTYPKARFAAIVRPDRAAADSLLARLAAGGKAADILRGDSLAGRATGSIREARQDQQGFPYHQLLFGELRPGQGAVVGPDRENTYMVIQLVELDPGRQLSFQEAAPFVNESLRNLHEEAALQALIDRHAARYRIEAHPELVLRIPLMVPHPAETATRRSD